MKRSIAAVVLVLALLGAAVWVGTSAVKKQNEPRKGRPPGSPAPVKTMTFFGTRVSGRRDGKPFWHFTADRVEQGLNGGPTTFFNLHDGVIYRDGQPYLNFTAEKAVYDSNLEQIHLIGRLHAVFPEGTFSTTDAVWYIRSEKLEAAVAVQVTGKDYDLEAGGMQLDLPTETALFVKGVALRTGGQGTVYTDTLTHSLKDGVFNVPGRVSLEVEISDEEDSESGN